MLCDMKLIHVALLIGGAAALGTVRRFERSLAPSFTEATAVLSMRRRPGWVTAILIWVELRIVARKRIVTAITAH